MGSPPRIRGKPASISFAKIPVRITPAYTGKTISFAFSPMKFRDHPRVYGENKHLAAEEKDCLGSPPRIRGKHSDKLRRSDNSRITPAYTGKTSCIHDKSQFHADHPRVYGENYGSDKYERQGLGSPPRIRGKQKGGKNKCWHMGITPAYTGKTGYSLPRKPGGRDHPRVYGENRRRTGRS